MAKEKFSYDTAIREIETTLSRIEKGTLGVDELAEQVARVNDLISRCRERLYQTESRIEKILEEPGDQEAEGQEGDRS